MNLKKKKGLFVFLLVLFMVFSLTSCDSSIEPTELTGVVEISTRGDLRQIPKDGVSLTVTLSYVGNSDVTIRYTTDESVVTETSTEYTDPLQITEDKTIKAKAFFSSSVYSEQSEKKYYKVTEEYSSVSELQDVIELMMAAEAAEVVVATNAIKINIDVEYNHIGLASTLTDLSGLFWGFTTFNGDISAWDVSDVENMSDMFNGATSFNQPLNDWNVSDVENMSGMFKGATSFNQPLNDWDVSDVGNMGAMFYGATSFNQPLNNWDVSAVGTGNYNIPNEIDMSSMISGAISLEQPILIGDYFDMGSMFKGATSFDQPLNDWDVSNVNDMYCMFEGATSFDQPLNDWDVSKVTDMGNMFLGATSFNQPLNNWVVSNVTFMDYMFNRATSFNQPLNNWIVSSVDHMEYMFAGDIENSTIFNQDISGWNVGSLLFADYMFADNSAFDQDLREWNDDLPDSDISHEGIIESGKDSMTYAKLPAKLGGTVE